MFAFLIDNANLIGLLFFFIIFTGIFIRLYLFKDGREKYENQKYIPLSDGDYDKS